MKGKNVLEVKELLGHRKLESTLVYLHFAADRNKDTTGCLIEGLSLFNEPAKVINRADRT